MRIYKKSSMMTLDPWETRRTCMNIRIQNICTWPCTYIQGHVTKLQCKIRFLSRCRDITVSAAEEEDTVPEYFVVRFEIRCFEQIKRGNLITININCAYKLFYIKIHYNKTVWVVLFIVQYQNTNWKRRQKIFCPYAYSWHL